MSGNIHNMIPATHNPPCGLMSRTPRLRVAVAVGVVLLSGFASTRNAVSQKRPEPPAAAQPLGVEIVTAGNEPELHVDGVPFFVHAAQFDYFRIPPDLWTGSLARYRELGINTIDLRIPWNWHELKDGEFDFDGHTNPRRNLRGLLKLIAQMHLRLVARPGPNVGDYWRNAGYPAWLLTQPEFKMSASAIVRGAAPPDAALMSSDADAAARDWLANETHMTHVRRWISAIARELAPYDAKSLVSITEPGKHEGETEEKQTGGPLLFVLLDDAVSLRPGSNGSDLWRYLVELREALSEGGLHAMPLLNVLGHDPRGYPWSATATPDSDPSAPGFVGEWFIAPPHLQGETGLTSVPSQSLAESSFLAADEVSFLATLVRSLATQRNFPPMLSGFSATAFVPSGDVRVTQPPIDDVLLASRILIGNGLRGLTYAPLQDTLTPAGWETPDTSRFFRWDAPLDLDGTPKPRAGGVNRNGQFVAAWGAMLASAHADVRLVNASEKNRFKTSLLLTQLISNQLLAPSPRLPTCVHGQLCAAALVSATNRSGEAATESYEMVDPLPSGGSTTPGKISLNITVPAHDSLLLPIHAPLCSTAATGEPCSDEVISAGAEFLGAQRDSKTLELAFYAPARATVRLRLDSAPTKVELDGDIRPDYQWNQETDELEVTLLRGAAPAYRRVLRIQLRYTPRVPQKPEPVKHSHSEMEYRVLDAIRAPLGDNVSIPTVPPLVSADSISGGRMVIATWNRSDETRRVSFELDGAFRGNDDARLSGGEQKYTRMRFQPSPSLAASEAAGAEGAGQLLRGNLTFRTGRELNTEPVLFLTADDAGNSHYQYDFDLDGAPEWVLESSHLRLIVSPAEAGRALTLIDKSTNDDLITLDGAFHDFLIPTGLSLENPHALGDGDFSFNRAYQAEWLGANKDVSLRLTYRQPQGSDAGLRVEKTIRLASPGSVEAVYRVSQGVPAEGPSTGLLMPRSFITMMSIPLPDPPDENARICWKSDAAAGSAPDDARSTPGQRCEDLVAAGRPVGVPQYISRVELECPGRRGLTVEWSAGRLSVIPKAFSADVDLVVPAPVPGEAPAEFTLRYTVAGSAK